MVTEESRSTATQTQATELGQGGKGESMHNKMNAGTNCTLVK